jgi:hypothetical protein
MASALECPAREILLERRFKIRTIAPLTAKEQDALIKQYLGRYTKQLIAELRQSILSHPLAGSPLFLRVLLEELRQCGRYETLADQLAGYLSAGTIDDLYERVLERLEADGNGENVRKVMTALWASRAGLSEEELLSITGLKPLEWAPIDLALEEALGRNGSRLVFDHDYLRKAVEDRYLPSEGVRKNAYIENFKSLIGRDKINEASARNMIQCLAKAGKVRELVDLLLLDSFGAELLSLVKPNEILEALSSDIDEEGQTAIRNLLDKISQCALTKAQETEIALQHWAVLGELALQSGIPHTAAIDCFERCCKTIEGGSGFNDLYAVAVHKKAESEFQICANFLNSSLQVSPSQMLGLETSTIQQRESVENRV